MAGKSNKKKRKVWYEMPAGSNSGRARCACHGLYPCPRAAASQKNK